MRVRGNGQENQCTFSNFLSIQLIVLWELPAASHAWIIFKHLSVQWPIHKVPSEANSRVVTWLLGPMMQRCPRVPKMKAAAVNPEDPGHRLSNEANTWEIWPWAHCRQQMSSQKCFTATRCQSYMNTNTHICSLNLAFQMFILLDCACHAPVSPVTLTEVMQKLAPGDHK